MYKPETKWQICSNLVYNLRKQGLALRKSTMPTMVNDVTVTIGARHLSKEDQERIAVVIAHALNKEFPVGD